MDLMQALFALSPAIRYVAISRDGQVQMQQRADLTNASAAESDRYEELLVNPARLTLTRQRGEIDCGGLRYVIVRYGHCYQLVVPVRGGHVLLAFEPDTSPIDHVPEVARTLRDHGL